VDGEGVTMLNFFGSSKKKPGPLKVREMLPATHAFVTYTARGNGPQGRVCFEGASLKTFRTTIVSGMVPGQSGVFTYANANGKFTFAARLVSLGNDQAVFKMPETVTALERLPSQERRAEPRIETSVIAEWRFKPAGRILAPWSKVVVSELSRTSASMMVERDFKPQEAIEIRAVLGGDEAVVLEATAVRSEPAGAKFKVSILFNHLDEESSHVITRFVNRRMTELRSRGLA
jgi:hypothetical protein